MGTIQEIEITTRVIRPPEIPIQAVRQPAAAVRQATGTAAAAQHQEVQRVGIRPYHVCGVEHVGT